VTRGVSGTELTRKFLQGIKELALRCQPDLVRGGSQGPKISPLTAETKSMKPIILVGILMVVLGTLALAYQGINYTRQKKVLEIGPIHATAETHERIPLPPILGGLVLVGGVVLLVTGARQKA
jgi:uncharacterized membrane protein